jgi:FtsP/CotA-like multicopper oxidase with cupredoxin domain
MPVSFDEHLPAAALDIVSTGETAALEHIVLRVEARGVVLAEGASPDAGKTNAWCYVRQGSLKDAPGPLANYLGPVLNVTRGLPLKVSFVNTLGSMPAMPPAKPGSARTLIDPPINPLPMAKIDAEQLPQWSSMNFSVGVVAHLHGGKVPHDSDGWPLDPASFSSNPFGFPMQRTYHWPNDQRAAMLWFHDHGMDNTAPQVHAGLAGVYFLRDQSDADIFNLIGSETQELPLVIQDRILAGDGRSFDYLAGLAPVYSADGSKITDFDRPEYLGRTIFVNGRQTPHAHVHPGIYRLRLLNGSNARSYALALAEPTGAEGGKVWRSDLFTVIGNDGGLYAKSLPLKETDYLLLAPGERLDVLADFSSFDGKSPPLVLYNLALKGLAADPTAAEPIYQTETESVLAPTDPNSADNIKDAAAFPQLYVMQFRFADPAGMGGMGGMCGAPALDAAMRKDLDEVLAHYACGDGFVWDAARQRLGCDPRNGGIVKNRLILLMNDTEGKAGDPSTRSNPITGLPWRDTQIWEMTRGNPLGDPAKAFKLPFDAQLSSTDRGGPSDLKEYRASRATFFHPEDETHAPKTQDPLWPIITENPHGHPPQFKYGRLFHGEIVRPQAGTYERWYVANIGNAQPEPNGKLPDMHPFHLHLVNFAVLNRYVLLADAAGKWRYVPAPRPSVDSDDIARHDTTRIQSNELVELLVWFPPEYKGRYPYHCHLVEHEDMGMMLHFETV